MGNMKAFKLAGVTFEGRLEKISKYCGHGSTFILEREPENKFDKNAINVKQVFKSGGQMSIGYVPKATAAEFAPMMDAGWIPVVKFGRKFINDKTGDCKGMQLRYEVQENGKYSAIIADVDRDMGKTSNG